MYRFYLLCLKNNLNSMALAAHSTLQPVPSKAENSTSLPGSETMALLLAGAFASVAMTKAALRQYRKLARKALWKAIGLKMKSFFSFKKQDPDTVLGLNFFVFLLLVILGVAIGAALFGLTGFLLLVGLAIIIYLLLRDR